MPVKKHIVVVGGGPAGAVIAMQLARADMNVTLLEANVAFEQKPGECLPPVINPILRKLELEHLLLQHRKSYRNQAVWGSDKMTEQDFIAGTYGLGTHIDRRQFERDLASESRKRGVKWYTGHILRDCQRHKDTWILTVQSKEKQKTMTVDFVVDATGRKSTVARYLNIKREQLDKLVGVSALISGHDLANTSTLIESCKEGWWYSASLPDNQLVVSFMTDSDMVSDQGGNREAGFKKLLKQTGPTYERIEHFLGASINNTFLTLYTYPAHASRLTQITGDGWLAVGDAACTHDPLSSYGITAAMGTAIYGSCAIVDHFKGKKESFLTYHYLMDAMYSACLRLVGEAYLREQRWHNSAFWKRRLA